MLLWNIQRSEAAVDRKTEVLQGTLDLMILKTLHALLRMDGRNAP